LAIAYLGLGSNVGDREKNIRDAVARLARGRVKRLKLSRIIETSPVGGPPQGLFLNAVLKVETDETPADLLKACQAVESSMGRVRKEKNGPRTIDIDVLLFDDLKVNTPDLVIPHPRMKDRDFVMKPLNEVMNLPVERYDRLEMIRGFIQEELYILLVFTTAAAGWFFFCGQAVPFLYEFASRYGAGDYSYLWDAFSVDVKAWASPGAAVVVLSYLAFQALRLFRRLRGVKAGPPVVFSWTMLGRSFLKEAGICLLVLSLGYSTFLFGRGEYVRMKESYFAEKIVRMRQYASLSPSERDRALVQYSRMNSRVWVPGLKDKYPLRARVMYVLMLTGFWTFVAGWGVVCMGRLFIWGRGRLAGVGP
jgi:2-amino-4-hydroxy-6-hydroxymethyldihydropteridine diphosphokinase